MNERELTIRTAGLRDIPRILELLRQVNNVHHDIRPDLFVKYKTKYEAEELALLMGKPDAAIFVAEDAARHVYGYLFALIRASKGSNLVPHKSLYIDDLCVDAAARGMGIGSFLLDRAKAYAKSIACDSITLNVWQGNDPAQRFYEDNAFSVRSYTMECEL